MTVQTREDDPKSHRVRLLPEKEDKLDDAPSEEQVRRTVVVSLSACLFYILVSSAMVFTNKALSYTYGFRTTNVLLFFQMIFTVVLLRFLRSAKFIDFTDFEMSRAKQVAPVSIFYSLNAAVALVALRELSVPSYTLIKRLSPLFTITLEAMLLNKYATRGIILSLLVMASGTVLAANADTSSSSSAWFLGFASCAFQALYLTFVKRSGLDTGMNSFGILYYHSILSIPCITAIAIGVGEIGPALVYDKWTSPSFLIVFIASLLMGLLLNYALFLCTELTSPTSTVVSGQVKAMGQTVIGVFTFGGVDMNTRYTCGTLLNISGGFMYAYAKLKLLRERG
ncbi:unnamed protein product [Agarophyton chilense]|eukprot:gb/GEZJ01001423.1/.p1 GENE.gb/GEZJ01001423.1/~~gb/GEZJ01001423.1/.p1  ORF type:complete len:339 (+),score=50.72 gb/GEZJ01001423.1/:402-1418(+)